MPKAGVSRLDRAGFAAGSSDRNASLLFLIRSILRLMSAALKDNRRRDMAIECKRCGGPTMVETVITLRRGVLGARETCSQGAYCAACKVQRANGRPRRHATVDRDQRPTTPKPQRIFADGVAPRAGPIRRCQMGVVQYPRPMPGSDVWDIDRCSADDRAAAAGEPGVAWHRGDLPEMSWAA